MFFQFYNISDRYAESHYADCHSVKWIVYIGEGYAIMPATVTVITYLPWPPWA